MLASMLHDHLTAERMMICIGSVMIALDILHDRKWPSYFNVIFYLALVSMFAVPLIYASDDPMIVSAMAIPVCYILFLALFFTGTIKGGADVKCLISMSVLFPVYPAMFISATNIPMSPMSVIMSFPVAVLFHAAVLSVLIVIPMAARNIIRGDTEFPRMFTGYRMNADDVSSAHVWPMEDIPDRRDGRIWVTPKIPFIVPMTVAVMFIAFTGGVMFPI
jgi:preflagellin peptidase FlaK